MKQRTAIVGGGLAGVTVAWQLHRLGCAFTLYEASARLGGTLRSLQRDGFLIELGPDGWVTEKPWAEELAQELGLDDRLQGSLDEGRVTHIVRDGRLQPMPDGMRMMVPGDLTALQASALISEEARAAYLREPARAEELRRSAPHVDESIASFVLRHFGNDVLTQIAAPLLSGIFGGSVQQLSVRAVMPQFAAMEREHGSLVAAVQARAPAAHQRSIFTGLSGGMESLIERMCAELPAECLVRNITVEAIALDAHGWKLTCADEPYSEVVLATPAHVTASLLPAELAQLLPQDASSAILVALAFDEHFELPPGFGFLVPEGSGSPLLACTFVDQKYPGRTPAGKRLLRAFFGGHAALPLMSVEDASLADLAMVEMRKLLGSLPAPAFSVVQRWPLSLPQYGVGHIERTAKLRSLLPRTLHLAGNAYRGVGVPDIIREARVTARHIAELAR